MTQLDHADSGFLSPPEYSDAAESGTGLTIRRFVFGFLVLATAVLLIGLFLIATGQNGFSPVQLFLMALFALTLPWTVIGFWNAVIGLAVMRMAENPEALVCPPLGRLNEAQSLAGKTAILFCIRNEDVRLVEKNAATILHDIAGREDSEKFEAFILSDSSDPEICLEEEVLARQLSRRFGDVIPVHYRRRAENSDFKAGNIMDFCDSHAERFDYALVLDADSVMSAKAIYRLVRLLDQNQKLGIVQSLVTGLPAPSAFARLFQFGMRLGMRSYTLGSAWWQGDCGPYWGHNALIRLKPFAEHCRLPRLKEKGPLGGPVLSHDQVEAVLMRRAGYEVRVVALEDESWEANPTTLLEFVRRDLRWCLGNMQYLKLFGLKDLKPVSRLQLWLAVLMFLSSPAWLGFVVIGALSIALSPHDLPIQLNWAGVTLYATIMFMIFAPKIATLIDVLLSADVLARYGSRRRLAGSFLLEILFSMLLAPVMAILVTRFLAGLLFGKRLTWAAQNRAASGVSFQAAVRHLWLPTLFGLSGTVLFIGIGGFAALIALPVFVGPLLSVPFAILTARQEQGSLLSRRKIACVPEEICRPVLLEDYQVS